VLKRLLSRLRATRVGAGEDLLAQARRMAAEGADDKATAALARHLESYPDDPEAIHLHGLMALRAGDLDAAADAIGRAAALEPGNALYLANLGLAMWRQGRLEAAHEALGRVVTQRPDMSAAAFNLAEVLLALGDATASVDCLREAIAHADPGQPALLASLWGALAGREALVAGIDAVECLSRAEELHPASGALSLLGFMPLAQRCDWTRSTRPLVDYLERQVLSPVEGPVIAPAVADCLPLTNPARLAASRRFAAMVEARVARLPRPQRATVSPQRDRRIRLGYLSADFHQHPTMQLLRGVLAAHDRQAFALHAYSCGPDDGSPMRREAEAAFDSFIDIRREDTAVAARRIAADGIDILVDLKGYTGAARPEVMALRPAPVQVNYLGYPGTMAASFIDYLIADPVLIPPGAEAWYGERVVSLPWSYQPNDDTQEIDAAIPTRAQEGLPPTGFVFCSFNTPYKIEPVIFSIWMEILIGTPGSVLWILADRDEARHNLRREAHSRGVAPERLCFAASLPKARHLARLRLADLALDTHFVNGHTTASDALWAGLPLITWPGESFASRVAASLLHAVGLPDMVCEDAQAYRHLAMALAGDGARLAATRARLAAQRHVSPLFDTRAYTRHLEAAFATMHGIARRGDAPAAFCVPRRIGAGR
jgi:predicted O-linked N-acetylglucosamine transferase (SPINDLY family)